MIPQRPLVRCVVVIAAALVLHVGFGALISVAGVSAELLAVLAAVAAPVAGRERAAMFGAGCGLANDLVTHAYFGMSMASLALVGYVAGMLCESFSDAAGRRVRALAAAASAAGCVAVFGLLGWLFSLAFIVQAPHFRIAGITAVVSFAVYPLAERIVRWALLLDHPLIDTRH